jgi:hypothetical protein
MEAPLLNTPLIVALLLLTSCAPKYAPPALTSDHPASPEAAAVAQPPRGALRTLDLSVADQRRGGGRGEGATAAQTAAAPSTPEHHDHGNHAGATAAPKTADAIYVCPMHPEVNSAKPDQRCPKCNMKLVKKEAAHPAGGNP